MKLTWSEASVFAFVWACALGYIVAAACWSGILNDFCQVTGILW